MGEQAKIETDDEGGSHDDLDGELRHRSDWPAIVDQAEDAQNCGGGADGEGGGGFGGNAVEVQDQCFGAPGGGSAI